MTTSVSDSLLQTKAYRQRFASCPNESAVDEVEFRSLEIRTSTANG
jgi:hypothetical protein